MMCFFLNNLKLHYIIYWILNLNICSICLMGAQDEYINKRDNYTQFESKVKYGTWNNCPDNYKYIYFYNIVFIPKARK